MGYASAMAWLLFLVILILTFLHLPQFRQTRVLPRQLIICRWRQAIPRVKGYDPEVAAKTLDS